MKRVQANEENVENMPKITLYESMRIIQARDPKQCAARILKGKVGRIKKYGVHSRWSLEEEMPVRFCKFPLERSL
jgi:hypothetical protein